MLWVLVAAPLAWLLMVYPRAPHAGRGQRIEVILPPGATLEQTARLLAREGALDHPRIWSLYARLRGAGGRLRSGRVVLTDSLSPSELLRRVAVGFGEGIVKLTFPEGWNRFQIARRLEHWGVCPARRFLEATADPVLAARLGVPGSTLEGYLFPARYRLPQGTTAERVAEQMVAAWRRRVPPLFAHHRAALRRLSAELGWGPHEVVVLASIVEKEAALPEERPLIAGVFLNRLRDPSFRPKRLQADPTAAYGCLMGVPAPSCQRFDGRRVTPTMLRDEANPYNTYRHEGLPPGPIANPSLGALRAVLAPARHDYLYFVAIGGGRHRFSRTFEAHRRAVQAPRSRAHRVTRTGTVAEPRRAE